MKRLPRRCGSAAARRGSRDGRRGAGGSPAGGLVDLVLHLVEVLVRELLRVAARPGRPSSGSSASASASCDVGVGVGGDAARAGDERRVDLLDLARGVLERLRHVLVHGLTRRGAEAVLGPRARLRCLARCRSRATTRLPLAGLAVARVPPAPLAVLPQRDAVGVVALGLVGLVVPPLAVLAGEGDCDPDVSAGHGAAPGEVVRRSADGSGQRKDPPRASQVPSLARSGQIGVWLEAAAAGSPRSSRR